MKTQIVHVSPPNSLLCISDHGKGAIPKYDGDRLIVASPSFIFVGCLMFQDGETQVILGPVENVKPNTPPAFDAFLDTPQHTVTVSTIHNEILLEQSVPMTSTRLRIWVNHPTEPDEIIVGLG